MNNLWSKAGTAIMPLITVTCAVVIYRVTVWGGIYLVEGWAMTFGLSVVTGYLLHDAVEEFRK